MKYLSLLLIAICCESCDFSSPFVIDGEKIHTLHNQCGTIEVRGASFSTSIWVDCVFNGEYSIATDSLKIKAATSEDSITTINFQLNKKEFIGKEIKTKGGETITFYFKLLPAVPYQKTTGTILILPSNFILCGDKPIITDTIKVQLGN